MSQIPSSKHKKNIFITGVSTGIGYKTAETFLQNGHTVIGTLRKMSDVDFFMKTYPHHFIGLQIDLLQIEKIEKITEELLDKNITHIDVLVNNAGIALAGPAELQNISEFQEMMTINFFAVVKVIQTLMPFLRVSTSARIINISSISGVSALPFLSGYAATKHAVEGFSKALRNELNIHNVHVAVIGPGSIKTPIWDKGFSRLKDVYKGSIYEKSSAQFSDIAEGESKNGLDPQAVVGCIEHAAFSHWPCLRYQPIPRKFTNWTLPRLLPDRIYNYFVTKALFLR